MNKLVILPPLRRSGLQMSHSIWPHSFIHLFILASINLREQRWANAGQTVMSKSWSCPVLVELCPGEEANVNWKIIRPVKVKVSTVTNTLTKRLVVLRGQGRGGLISGYHKQRVSTSQTDYMHRDSNKSERQKNHPLHKDWSESPVLQWILL